MSGPTRKRALLIGTGAYRDKGFAPLPCTAADVVGMKRVLEAQSIGGFDHVTSFADLNGRQFRQAVHDFLDGSERDELSVVYISGHGMLEASTGEFQFIASDTDRHDLARTAVPAGYLNDRLLECRARERVVILDCCHSGGFAVGFRTKGAGAPDAETDDEAGYRPLRTKGVVVISSSQASEVSYGGSEPDGPSLFTEHLVQALTTGAADVDRDGRVSAMELYEHLSSRLRALDRKRWQAPVVSAIGVDGPMYLAKAPLSRTRRGAAVSSGREVKSSGSDEARAAGAPGVKKLIGYYRDCVLGESAADTELVFKLDSVHYVPISGADQLLSATDSEAGGVFSVPEELESLAARAVADKRELVYGYPVVVLHGDRSGRPYPVAKLAPVLLRRLELVQGADGGLRLRPYGEAEINPAFAKMWVGEEEAENLRWSYRPGWTAGDHYTMARDVRAVLRDTFELDCVEELRPERLESRIDVDVPRSGARNAAVMMAVKSELASKSLFEDLDDVVKKCVDPAALGATALAPLFGHQVSTVREAVGEVMLSPLNPAQREVLASAMSRQLTVATGPPGTGKSALVVSLVAAAVAAGERVLVASTNNRAVDEVWRRCSTVVPGLVVRTGSSSGEIDYRVQEQIGLRSLLSLTAPETNAVTWRARHGVALHGYRDVLAAFGAHAQAERELLDAGKKRQMAHDALLRTAAPAVTMVTNADSVELAHLEARARKVIGARVFGVRRRRRFLATVHVRGIENAAEARALCEGIGSFAAAESIWRTLISRPLRDDATLTELLSNAEKQLVDTSTGWVEARIRQAAVTQRAQIQELADVVTRRAKDWPQRKKALAGVPAWAVTCLSARKFTPDPGLFDLVVIDEASQCSIPAVIPLLMRAKRALIIGDPLQLPPVIKLPPVVEAESRERHCIDADWLIAHRAGYRDFSAFHALEQAAGGSILLHEHYRCHPQIAGIANELFYTPRDKPLTVLTRTAMLRRAGEDRAVRWVDVEGRAVRTDSGSWGNDREVERVHDAVAWLLRTSPPEATIGVVTPFAAQAAKVARSWADEPRVRVGTAHRFQGGECDAVVFSLVAARGMSRFGMGYLERSPNLWNVAITRARAHLIIIGDRQYWMRAGGLGRGLLEFAEEAFSASESSEGVIPGFSDALLLKRLDPGADGKVELAVPNAGYVADALVTRGSRRTAILIDRGSPDEVLGERHLRLQLIRASLLASGADDESAIRLPAWRLFDESWQLASAAS